MTKPPPAPQAPQQWEFDIISPGDEGLRSELDAAGKSGWMISSCRRATREAYGKTEGIYECIMQRPKGGTGL